MKIYFADAFTNQAFKGNPAAVCILEKDLNAATMQNIATEIGFSETAFIQAVSDTVYNIRYFSPRQEIPLCGHATLASSKVVFETTNADQLTFITGENLQLPIRKDAERIIMEFPVYTVTDFEVPDSMLAALGIDRFIHTCYSPNTRIIVIEIAQTDSLAGLNPDFGALVKSYSNIKGVLVTAGSISDGYDFHYRYFWPWSGTNEDPVTGGVQTFLTKYWADKLNKTTLKAFQSSLRTGQMTTVLFENKVLIYGEAVIVLEGDIKL